MHLSPNIEPVGAPDVAPAVDGTPSSRSDVARWWWLVVLGGIVVAASAGALVVRRRP
jgi:hypothetical protein